MSHKEKAVEIFTKYFLREKNVPYEDRKIKAKKESLKYIQTKIEKAKEPEDHFYWEYLKGYVNKIKV